jgi:hypothetical protein
MLLVIALGSIAAAENDTNPARKLSPDRSSRTIGSDEKWVLPNGEPTYDIQPDGTVDWFTYAGFRRYQEKCQVCHGGDGRKNFNVGGPLLRDQMPGYDFQEFDGLVSRNSGPVAPSADRFIMPLMFDDNDVMCHKEEIFIYLKAVSDGSLPWNEQPKLHAPEMKVREDQETKCRARRGK